MKILAALTFASLIVAGCNRAPNQPVAVIESAAWKMLAISSDGRVTGRGTAILSLTNTSEKAIVLTLQNGPLERGSKALTVEGQIPRELTALFPVTLQPGESVSATYESGGVTTPGAKRSIFLPVTINGQPAMLEGPCKVSIQE